MVRKRITVLMLALLVPLLFGLLLFDAVNPSGTVQAAPAVAPVVNTLVDENDGCGVGECSLRDAISDTIATGTIEFSVAGTIVLSSTLGELTIDKDLTIDGGDVITVSGDNAVRVFNISGGNVILDSLAITNGKAPAGIDEFGGGIYTSGGTITVTNSTLSSNRAIFGGGIYNSSVVTLSVSNSTLTGNSATGTGDGGGIYNNGTLMVTNSIFSGNSAKGNGGGIENWHMMFMTKSTLTGNLAKDGGGIANFGTVTVSNSTLSSNSAKEEGGAIYTQLGEVTLNNSTVTGNRAVISGGGLASAGFSGMNTAISNSIVSGNIISDTAAPDDLVLFASTTDSFSSGGYNLIGAIGANITFSGTGDITGVNNPKLSPLAANGGDTLTHALLSDSQAIDNGNCSSGPATDQRGVPRPQDLDCDIGAFEVPCSITVLNNQSNGSGTLRHAIADICEGGLITFDGGLANSTIDHGTNHNKWQ